MIREKIKKKKKEKETEEREEERKSVVYIEVKFFFNTLWNNNALTKRESTIIEFKGKQEMTYHISSVISVIVEFLALIQDMLPSWYLLIGAWLTMALVALAYRELEWPKY